MACPTMQRPTSSFAIVLFGPLRVLITPTCTVNRPNWCNGWLDPHLTSQISKGINYSQPVHSIARRLIGLAIVCAYEGGEASAA